MFALITTLHESLRTYIIYRHEVALWTDIEERKRKNSYVLFFVLTAGVHFDCLPGMSVITREC